ncbi:MAG: hypothetical protein HRK26_04235 [Rickettsiaceae bacterium H1]|nr:hypothetical protein [Rickettsiaceae bacterium H1]
MTIISPPEFSNLSEDYRKFIGYPLTISLIGVGNIVEDDNETVFIVSSCKEANTIRALFGLGPADLHVTLGFKTGDIFNKPKDRSALLPPFSRVVSEPRN